MQCSNSEIVAFCTTLCEETNNNSFKFEKARDRTEVTSQKQNCQNSSKRAPQGVKVGADNLQLLMLLFFPSFNGKVRRMHGGPQRIEARLAEGEKCTRERRDEARNLFCRRKRTKKKVVWAVGGLKAF